LGLWGIEASGIPKHHIAKKLTLFQAHDYLCRYINDYKRLQPDALFLDLLQVPFISRLIITGEKQPVTFVMAAECGIKL
jgi:hypothetical protein